MRPSRMEWECGGIQKFEKSRSYLSSSLVGTSLIAGYTCVYTYLRSKCVTYSIGDERERLPLSDILRKDAFHVVLVPIDSQLWRYCRAHRIVSNKDAIDLSIGKRGT